MFRTSICFEFDNQLNDLTQADQFKEIFCQLLYEVTYQQPVSQVSNPIEYLTLCAYVFNLIFIALSYLLVTRQNMISRSKPKRWKT